MSSVDVSSDHCQRRARKRIGIQSKSRKDSSNKNTALLMLSIAERGEEKRGDLQVIVHIEERIDSLRLDSRELFNGLYPGIIRRGHAPFGHRFECFFKNRTSEEEEKRPSCESRGAERFYLATKPPPNGSASRIDAWSLRDVITCCQTVLASTLALFGLRFKISATRRRENFNAEDDGIGGRYRWFSFEFRYLILHLSPSIRHWPLAHWEKRW